MAERVSGAAQSAARSSAFTDFMLGAHSGIASTVYGTVVVMATLTAAYASEKNPWRLAVIVSVTALVLWIAHMYAHALAESIVHDHRLSAGDFATIAHRERGIILAAVLPCVALVLGAIGVLAEYAAVWLALGIGLGVLAAEGVRYARMERLGRLGLTVAVVGNVVLGSLVVWLKVIVFH